MPVHFTRAKAGTADRHYFQLRQRDADARLPGNPFIYQSFLGSSFSPGYRVRSGNSAEARFPYACLRITRPPLHGRVVGGRVEREKRDKLRHRKPVRGRLRVMSSVRGAVKAACGPELPQRANAQHLLGRAAFSAIRPCSLVIFCSRCAA